MKDCRRRVAGQSAGGVGLDDPQRPGRKRHQALLQGESVPTHDATTRRKSKLQKDTRAIAFKPLQKRNHKNCPFALGEDHLIPSESMNTLKTLMDEISSGTTIEFGQCPESLDDVVFDVNTAESALVGIADQLLSNMMPSPDQLAVLDKTLMKGNLWLMFDGGNRDLTNDEVLLRHAQLLVSLQQECREFLIKGDGRIY